MDLDVKLPKKSAWRGRIPQLWNFFCPNCKQHRQSALPRNPMNSRALLQVGLATAFFMLMTWHWFHIKGAVAFVPIWAIYEAVYRVRVRARLSCPHCGFDPFLYVRNTQLARKEIENYWRKKFKEKGVAYPGDPVAESTKGHAAENLSESSPSLTESNQ